MIERGAGHFQSGCAPCHGAPGIDRSPVVLAMTPPPPDLSSRIVDWEREELFWIVRHGIKFSGMPAWPAPARADEPWSLVAFLLHLPRLGAERYRELAFGPVAGWPGKEGEITALASVDEALRPALANCARCHGLDGNGRGTGAAPVLGGLSYEYILASLHAYASGARHSGIVQLKASGLDAETVQGLARHYARQPPTQAAAEPPGGGEGLADGELGARIARDGLPAAGVPACGPCHGPARRPRNPLYPLLAGQYADYQAQQLELWRKGKRGGTAYAHVMRQAARFLTDEQIRAVSGYYAALPPGSP